jgi:purine-binding chemotaxis protein CheW
MTPIGDDLAVICRVQHRLYALRVADVVETMRPLAIEPLANMPSFVRGLAVIRGIPVPVIDAAALLGTSHGSTPTRFITLRAGGRSVALAVAEVVGVRAINGASLQDLPPLLQEASRDTITAVGTLDTELLMVLQAARMLPESVWEALGFHEAAP